MLAVKFFIFFFETGYICIQVYLGSTEKTIFTNK